MTAMSNKMTVEEEINEYNSYGAEIREVLDSNFQYQMFSGNLEDAYETLGKLMSYKLIDINDPRIEKKNKSFQAAGIDPDHRFTLDYRKSTGYIPAWLYGNLEYTRTIKFNSIPHKGKRVEGNYEGKIVIPSRSYNLRITSCTNEQTVRQALTYSLRTKLAKDKQVNFTGLDKLCINGVYRAYRMEFTGNVISKYQEAGCAIVRMAENGVHVTLFINYENIINNWIDVKDFTANVAQTLKGMTGAVSMNCLNDMDGALAEQKAILSNYSVTAEELSKATSWMSV